jgi:Tol biopolymer transport system component
MQQQPFHPRTLPALSLACLGLTAAAFAGGGANGLTERILFAPDGTQTSQDAWISDVSADGRFAVFQTVESLDPQDTNAFIDVYRLDRATGEIRCASVTASGTSGNGVSRDGRVSDDGRYVVFETEASNLVVLDSNGESDVLRKDFQTGIAVRMSNNGGGFVAANGKSASPDISADGRYVVFRSTADDIDPATLPDVSHIYWRDTQTAQVLRLTTGVFGEPVQDSYSPSITADGMRVAYTSASSGLVLFDVNGVSDVFVQDIGGPRKLLSRGPGGVLGDGSSTLPFIARDGDWVAYHSHAENLDAGDINGELDVFTTHVDSGSTVLVSQLPNGYTGAGDSFVTGTSDDGQYVVFVSQVAALNPASFPLPSVYVRDIEQETTAMVSRPSGVTLFPNNASYAAVCDANATEILFSSFASNLDQGDTNAAADVFSRSLLADPTEYCFSSTTSAGCQPQIGWSGVPSASQDAGFTVSAANVPNNKVGILFYSLQGRDQIPFLGGALCTGPLAGRSPGMTSGGNPGISDCSGSFAIDMNGFAAGLLGGTPHAGLALVGQQINAQFWGRDPEGLVHTSFLSDALEYFVGP